METFSFWCGDFPVFPISRSLCVTGTFHRTSRFVLRAGCRVVPRRTVTGHWRVAPSLHSYGRAGAPTSAVQQVRGLRMRAYPQPAPENTHHPSHKFEKFLNRKLYLIVGFMLVEKPVTKRKTCAKSSGNFRLSLLFFNLSII